MQSTEAKSEILSAIRRSLAESAPFDRIHAEHAARHAGPAGAEPLVSEARLREIPLIERFRENLVSVGGNCETVRSRTEAARLIREIVEKSGARKIAVTDSGLVAEIGNLLGTVAEILPNASKEDLFECDLGITGAGWGIAETGTLVLESEKESHRLASLVPPAHVCLLDAKRIRQSLGEVLEILEKDLSPTITFITGPSRTSDIELTLAIGVHGPGQLFVILIDGGDDE